jgi:hypothetical protein
LKKYVHVPVEVEAVMLTKDNAEEVAQWCGGRIVEEVNPLDRDDVYVGINFPTYDGNKRLSQGMVLVRNSRGGFQALSKIQFEKMYGEL